MPRFERLSNDAKTSLDGSIGSAVTSIVVNDGSVLPSLGDYRIKIDNEICKVTKRSTNTLTVVRGVDDTTGVSHANGSEVRLVATSEQLARVVDDITGGQTNAPPRRVLDTSGDPLLASGFTWVNQGTSTITDTRDGVTLLPATGTAPNLRCAVISAPPTPWTLRARVYIGYGITFNSTDFGGICLRENSTGELETYGIVPFTGKQIRYYNSPTSLNTTVNTENLVAPYLWVRVNDNGTNITWSHGVDGINWHVQNTHSRTAFMAGGPDEIGFFGNATAASGNQFPVHLTSFTII